jgi:hypothetical protein
MGKAVSCHKPGTDAVHLWRGRCGARTCCMPTTYLSVATHTC